MGFSCGIVGLPNVGKSTIFRALTSKDVTIEPFAFSTVSPNTGTVDVPDERLDHIAMLLQPVSIVPTSLNFVDIAGLVEGASAGEGMGNQFLNHIRKVDSIIHVVRCFPDANVPHIAPDLNPSRDIDIVELEIMLKDIESINKRIEKTKKGAKGGDKEAIEELNLLEMVKEDLDEGIPVRSIDLSLRQQEMLAELFLISAKPELFVANIGEDSIGDDNNELLLEVKKEAADRNAPTIVICSKLEAELSSLPSDERDIFADELGIGESGLKKLIRTGYDMLNLLTFFTTRSDETRAWTIKEGTNAVNAAGKIHTDMASGFIKAEVLKYEDLLEFETEAAVRDEGLAMIAGREYLVEDGDIVLFKFRV